MSVVSKESPLPPINTDVPSNFTEDGPKTESAGPQVVAAVKKTESGLSKLLKLFSTTEGEILLVSTFVKVMLFPAYRSTDFEVHRNWLAITHSLPISKWYYDTTSEWTLDYPPFFAYFEWILSLPAALIDPKIVDVNNLGYDAWSVVAYQRTTVILTELVLGAAVLRFIKGATNPDVQRIISISLFLHPGGIMLLRCGHLGEDRWLSVSLLGDLQLMRKERVVECVCVCRRGICLRHGRRGIGGAWNRARRPNLKNFLSLANSVILIFVLSLGPFLLMGQITQLLSRLFPFTRGLNHAYWAANVWALVTALDRVLLRFVKNTAASIAVNASGVSSTSRGLVGDTVFAVLPNIKPIQTFLITITCQTAFLTKLWFVPTYRSFLMALTLCGYASFMFGWHVHEKAVLLILVPLSLLAGDSHAMFRTYLIASVAGVYGLFPLLFTPAETFIKIVYSLVWSVLCLYPLSRQTYDIPSTLASVVLDRLEKLYLYGFALLQLIVTIIDSTGKPSLAFLPLLLTSVYCSLGLSWGFVRLSYLYLARMPWKM
ncbi:glycosyltransferase family 57 protein [Sphaerobolus stellatus SS14]|uniref:Alpha-1,3-glucosyltransferase n=1 Tax=Sphaerobolus stellatus (strain SS14) TaxID=990650 RepID=A0A0C9VJC8_SPHS4|nr:glycosyltransferase family 57 protein [Sphaerobolus stellatus SS14]